jgi:hypothetical protein
MKNIDIKFDYKAILQFLLKRFSIVLWVFLGLVIIAEGFVIKDSLNKILTATDQSVFAGAQLIRVNFTVYDTIEKHIDGNSKFLPEFDSAPNPFGTKPEQ